MTKAELSLGTKPRLIVYELNELPKRVLLEYCKDFPGSTLSKLIRNSFIIDTYCSNIGELHPWSTWPTLHRGVSNEVHKINHLNQDLDQINKLYPPIWDTLNHSGVTTGIFGALQSYPPSRHPLSLFFLPDTFAPAPDAHPAELNVFQKLNLPLVSRSRAVPATLTIRDFTNALNLILSLRIKPRTAFVFLKQFLAEILRAKHKLRRSLLQAHLSFDLFEASLDRFGPQYSSFFTNHLAGMMHRYWIHMFPEDYERPVQPDSFNRGSIVQAMHIVDGHLKRLMRYCKNNDSELLLVSSMGQAAVDRGHYRPEYILSDPLKLLSSLNLDPSCYQTMLSMQPDIVVACRSHAAKDKLLLQISKLSDSLGARVIEHRYPSDSLTVNLSLRNSSAYDSSRVMLFDGAKSAPANYGFKLISRHQGTAYHIPEGVAVPFGPRISSCLEDYKTSPIDTTRFCGMYLSYFS